MESIKTFEYKGQQIEFDLSKINMMVNATEMAKIYDKRIDFFLKSDNTKSFIQALKFPPKGGNLTSMKDEEIMITKGRSGTWMNRILALKFAAWLDPNFEVWVYHTIDVIMFGTMREDALTKAKAETKREVLHQKLLRENPDYAIMMNLDDTAKTMGSKIKKQMRSQLSIMFEENQN
jgi:KilA-N domain